MDNTNGEGESGNNDCEKKNEKHGDGEKGNEKDGDGEHGNDDNGEGEQRRLSYMSRKQSEKSLTSASSLI